MIHSHKKILNLGQSLWVTDIITYWSTSPKWKSQYESHFERISKFLSLIHLSFLLIFSAYQIRNQTKEICGRLQNMGHRSQMWYFWPPLPCDNVDKITETASDQQTCHWQ